MPDLKSRASWHDLLIVHRLQFPLPVNYLCYAIVGCGFATGDVRRLLDPRSLLAVVANLLLIVAPLALNVATDVPTDAKHADKAYLAGSAGWLGRERVLGWASIEMMAGLLAALSLGLVWGRWWPVIAAAAILVAQLLYNLEPVRLKRRGLAGSAAFGVASVGFPLLLGYTALNGHLDAAMWLVFAGTSVLSVGRTLWWAIPDHAADVESGVATPTVRYGPVRAFTMACLLLAAGLVLLGLGLSWRYGALWCAAGLAAHTVFFGCTVRQLGRTVRGHPPRAGQLLRRTLPVVTLGEISLTVLAFAA